jgi:hypothetical protein
VHLGEGTDEYKHTETHMSSCRTITPLARGSG